MRIGFDGKRVTQNFTGLGNYGRYVLNLLACTFPENSYRIYSPKPPDEALKETFSQYQCLSVHSPVQTAFSSFWRMRGIVKDLKRDKIDLFHGLSNEIPLGLRKAGIPSVVTIHDLIFLRYPHYYNFIDRKIYEFKVSHVCKHASQIIAVSNQTRKDLISFFNIPEDRIHVVYQNCNSIYLQAVSDNEKQRVRSQYQLPQQYLLNVGTVEARKNVLLIVKALKAVPENIHLVIIGKPTEYTKQVKQYVKENNLLKRVHFLSKVPLTDLPAIYQQAEMFIYPSEFEGFGIPIVEALHSGVPVIAATGSCLEEAGGPGSCYVHPKDETQMAYHINFILRHPEKRQHMIEEGYRYVQKFSDKRIADELMNVYIKTLNKDDKSIRQA